MIWLTGISSFLFFSMAKAEESLWTLEYRDANPDQCVTIPGRPNCIASNLGGSYDDNVFCIFQISVSGQLQVTQYDVQQFADVIYVNAYIPLYDEDEIDNHPVVPGDTLIWVTNGLNLQPQTGWEICVVPDGLPPPLEEESAWKVVLRDEDPVECLTVPDEPNCITYLGGDTSSLTRNMRCFFQVQSVYGRLEAVEFNVDSSSGFSFNTQNGQFLTSITEESEINSISVKPGDLLSWISTRYSTSTWQICIIPDHDSCCTNNFGECYINNAYCNANEGNCENECDGFWFPVDEGNECNRRWDPCSTSDECCNGVVCVRNEDESYDYCGLDGIDGTVINE